MKKMIKLNLLGFFGILGLNSCGDIHMPPSSQPISYETKTVFKDTNGDKILYFKEKGLGSSAFYKLSNEIFLEISNEEKYNSLRKSHLVQVDLEQKNNLNKVKDFMINKYKITKGTLASIDSKLSVITLIAQDLNYSKNDFFVFWTENNQKYNRIFHLKKDGESFLDKELNLPSINGKKINLIKTLDKPNLQISNHEYNLFTVYEQHDKQYIPIFNTEQNEVVIYALNQFIKEVYNTEYDVQNIIKSHIYDALTFYEDGLYIIYDKSEWNKNAEMVYHHVPFDTPTEPIVLNVPIK